MDTVKQSSFPTGISLLPAACGPERAAIARKLNFVSPDGGVISGRPTVSTLSRMAFLCKSPSVSSFCSFFAALGVVFEAAFRGAGFAAGAGFVGVFFGGGDSLFTVAVAGLGFLGVNRLDVFGAGRNSASSSDLTTSAFLFVGVVFCSSLTVAVAVFVGVDVEFPFFVPFVDVVPLAG